MIRCISILVLQDHCKINLIKKRFIHIFKILKCVNNHNLEFKSYFNYIMYLKDLKSYFKHNFTFKMIHILFKWIYKNNLFINNIIWVYTTQ